MSTNKHHRGTVLLKPAFLYGQNDVNTVAIGYTQLTFQWKLREQPGRKRGNEYNWLISRISGRSCHNNYDIICIFNRLKRKITMLTVLNEPPGANWANARIFTNPPTLKSAQYEQMSAVNSGWTLSVFTHPKPERL